MDAIPAMTFTRKSEDGIRKLITGLDRMAEDVAVTGPLAIKELTDLLEQAVAREFGSHHPGRPDEDRAGEHDGRYGGGFWGDQHPRTLDTLEKESHGMVGRVSIAGGGPYVEFGTQSHEVTPRGRYPLHWRKDGIDYFSGGHEISGTKADDFAGRALEDVSAESVIASVFSTTFLKIIRELE